MIKFLKKIFSCKSKKEKNNTSDIISDSENEKRIVNINILI
jgi:hypothetical protein